MLYYYLDAVLKDLACYHIFQLLIVLVRQEDLMMTDDL